jgi:hypothetical protein
MRWHKVLSLQRKIIENWGIGIVYCLEGKMRSCVILSAHTAHAEALEQPLLMLYRWWG